MSFMTSAGQMINNNNRRLQRKRNRGFRTSGLPLAKRTNELLEPVSPLVAKDFKAKLELERKRKEMATGLFLLLALGLSAALFLMVFGLL